MHTFRKFARGYMQTMLYGIEERPKFKMDGTFYFILHLINHFQYLSIIVNANQNKRFSDFKLAYSQNFLEFFILNNTLKSSMTSNLALVIIIISFASQLILILFLMFSTFIRVWTANLIRRDITGSDNMNSNIQQWVISFNETLHWFFVLYPVIYLQIAVISFSSLTCNSVSIFPKSDCEIGIGTQIIAITPLIISYINGQILIYIMRNHRFHEPNSLKRRYSSLLLLNNTVILIEIFSHYIYEFQAADILKYSMANLFAINQIVDQLTNFPYRDPIRIPSIRLAFVYAWIVIAVTAFKFGLLEEENLFFLIILPLPGLAIVGETLSSLFQNHAILNYNSSVQIEEKHIIIAVDQFYKYHIDYLKDPQAQLQYLQFLMIHRLYCKNNKCYSKLKRFETLDVDQKKDLNTLTLSIIKCIFKAAQNWLFSIHNLNTDLQFEQLQLQYISFVSEIAQKPLIGYIELRQYQNNKLNNNSTYFIEITNKLADQLKKQITDNQVRQNSKAVLIHEQRTQLIEISLTQQWQTQNLYENLLQTYINLVDQKIEHWQNLINGYPSLNPFQYNTQKLCEKIMNLRIALDKYIGVPQEWFDLKTTTTKGIAVKKLSHAQLNINVITLKLYSLFYSLVMNDFDRTVYVEQYVKDLTSNDRQKEIDIIDNISIYNDSTTIILVSIVKNKGKIVNKNQLALANFFHYIDANDFKESVSQVHNLLPKTMMKGHEYLIDAFIQKGHSEYFIRKISGYYENKKGFIEKCYVKLGNLFEELDDYVITASILKCNISNQLILVDAEGKIIGISEELYKTISSKVPNITIDFFKEFCHLFLVFPSFLTILNQNLNKINELDHQFIEDEEHLFYIPSNLVELNSLFVRESYEKMGNTLQEGLESQNLSSWRSWKSVSKSLKSEHSYGFERGNTTILGEKVPIADKSNINFHYQFMNQHKDLLEKYTIIRTRIKISYQMMKVKRYSYPYFIIELEHMNEITSQHKFYNKYPTMGQNFEASTTMFNSAQNHKSLNETVPSSADRSLQDTKPVSFQPDKLVLESQYNKQINKSSKINEEKIKQLIQQDDSNILFGNDHSQIRLFDKPSAIEVQDISAPPSEIILPKNAYRPDFSGIPVQKDQDNDSDEFFELHKQFDEKSIKVEEKVLQKEKSSDEFKDKDESQQEIEDNLEKHSSNQNGNKKNFIQLLMENKKMQQENQNDNDEEEKKKRSIASSSKTSTSKSPSLLVRSLYQVSTFGGGLKSVIFAILVYLILQFCLVFVKLSIIQNNYDILQTNINYVTYPETLNFYFQKIAFFAWISLQERLDIIEYSDFIKKQQIEELIATRAIIDIKLNELYKGIIQFEEQIMNDELKLVSINDLSFSEQQLDLTQLIQQIQLHAFNYMDNAQDGVIFSDCMFFRLNIPYVYQFAYKYITLLNENLVYYEDRIINDVVVLTMTFIAVNSCIILYILYNTYLLTQYERQILMLITRVSHKTAEDIMQKLTDVKTILIEPSQLLWKRVNYFELNYEQIQQNQQVTNLLFAKSVKTQSVTKSNELSVQKSKLRTKRSYQSNSLAQRIYDLTLSYPSNLIFLFFLWFLAILFIIGGILVTISQVSDIKPTLNLNLQLIRFKLRFDTLIVLGECLKTQQVISDQFKTKFGNINIDMKNQLILDLFSEQTDGFQDSMRSIYDSLASQSGLLEAQKKELLMYFEDSLCNFMSEEIPFCTIRVSNQNFSVPDSFKTTYGNPWLEDNNFDYLSGGITGCVQEFTKTLNLYFSKEILLKQFQVSTTQEAVSFLKTQIHINQFVEYYLDSGKLLSIIGDNLFEQNQSKLQQATTIMQLYIYITGLGLLIILGSISYFWVKYVSSRMKLMRLSLTLIPYEILLEPKTMSSLKQL
ncbi:unnamed protein product [Paramecium primaurelia]|uniref:Transmembrane protein n=1 Tax=Paramecium primaurelia TaxID=5886 RepID=A0A8S1NL74_PARPR|nr:unnamed protein product [Paramecium primaurelia]